MREKEKSKKHIRKIEISGSETIIERIRRKLPWIFGEKLRKPKIIFPKLRIRRLSIPLPPNSLSIIIVFIILGILQTGIVYLIVRNPSALGVTDIGEPEFIFPENIHEAYIIESIVASVLITLFSVGFIFLYQASKYVYNKKLANWYLIIGLLVILIMFAMLQFMLYVKTPRWLRNIIFE
ncbi:MAG: hypothetical protein ACFE8N_08850 [Promethearchaeota archaeon]